jgi:hypothetical protein
MYPDLLFPFTIYFAVSFCNAIVIAVARAIGSFGGTMSPFMLLLMCSDIAPTHNKIDFINSGTSREAATIMICMGI